MKKHVNFSVKALTLSHTRHVTLLLDQFYVYTECGDKADALYLENIL